MTTDPTKVIPPPKRHLALAWLGVLLFFPFGLAAVAKSSKVPALWQQRRYAEALGAAASAKALAIMALVCLALCVAAGVAMATFAPGLFDSLVKIWHT